MCNYFVFYFACFNRNLLVVKNEDSCLPFKEAIALSWPISVGSALNSGSSFRAIDDLVPAGYGEAVGIYRPFLVLDIP